MPRSAVLDAYLTVMFPRNISNRIPGVLTSRTYTHGIQELSDRFSYFARIVDRFGPAPFWTRQEGFETLLRLILEQQVSLASARAAYERLTAVAAPLTAHTFLALDAETLRAVGFSRQKAEYGRGLAQAIVLEELDLDFGEREDSVVREALMRIKGIGRWTADVYLLEALRRPDIWPSGDLALATAVQTVLRRKSRPTVDEMERLSLRYRPWRAVAARLFWHDYLCRRGQCGGIV